MSTTKTVNITSGKVLNYSVTAEGYKPVTGSKLITSDTNIAINMIPLSSEDGVYTFGDRIGGIATFVGYFTSTDPNTQEDTKLAFFVLDAKYRTNGKDVDTSMNAYYNWGLPQYTDGTRALNAKESSTYNTQFIYDNYTNSVSTSSFRPFHYARNSAPSILVNGNYYSPQLPNLYELKEIWTNRVALDTYDPTLENYVKNNLTDWSFSANSNYMCCCSSNEYSNSSYWGINRDGSTYAINKSTDYSYRQGIIPVLEIPVL